MEATNLVSGFVNPRWASESDDEPDSKSRRWKQYLLSALPRFLQPAILEHRKIGPTSYLDALRGYASLIVVFYHVYPTKDGVSDEWRHQPMLNLIDAGRAMVILFYLISGYALSYRLLILTRRGDTDRLLSTLASATFRRWFRLYLSCVVAGILALPMIRIGWYNGFSNNLYQPTLSGQLMHFAREMIRFINPVPGHMTGSSEAQFFHTDYLVQLWTIPIEYRGSMILFAFVLATCKMSPRTRAISTGVMMLFCYVWMIPYVAEFLAGMVLADLTLGRHPERVDKQIDSLPEPPRPSTWATVAWSCLLFVGLFLLARPKNGDEWGVMGSFPWAFLNRFTPFWWDYETRYWFWFGPGAFAVLLALESCPVLQTPFNWRVSQYVGDLSFGMYATHPPYGFAIRDHVAAPLRAQYLGDSFFAHALCFVLIMFTVVSVADYFDRIDRKNVAFARWLQQRLFT